MKGLDGKQSEYKTKNKTQTTPGYSSEVSKYKGFFVMAMANYAAVKRDNALLKYGKKLKYHESEVVPSFTNLLKRHLAMMPIPVVFGLPAIRDMVLPKPGEGPGREEMENKYYLHVVGVGTSGKQRVANSLYIKGCPGYLHTASMMMESAVAMALNRKDLVTTTGGVLGSAACFGDIPFQKLAEKGILESKVVALKSKSNL